MPPGRCATRPGCIGATATAPTAPARTRCAIGWKRRPRSPCGAPPRAPSSRSRRSASTISSGRSFGPRPMPGGIAWPPTAPAWPIRAGRRSGRSCGSRPRDTGRRPDLRRRTETEKPGPSGDLPCGRCRSNKGSCSIAVVGHLRGAMKPDRRSAASPPRGYARKAVVRFHIRRAVPPVPTSALTGLASYPLGREPFFCAPARCCVPDPTITEREQTDYRRE